MELENVVIDCQDPAAVAAFWTAALGLTPGSADDDLVEARLSVPDGPWLDFCFQRVATPAPAYGPGLTGPRLHLGLALGGDRDAPAARLLALGAHPADIGQRDVRWAVLADVEDNLFCVFGDEPAWANTGPLGDIPVDSADPERDVAFWSAMTGWHRTMLFGGVALRHPSGRGTHVSFWPEPAPKPADVKNRLHLDVRPSPGEPTADCLARALDLGATRVAEPWAQGHDWTVLRDPSGNEFCLLAGAS